MSVHPLVLMNSLRALQLLLCTVYFCEQPLDSAGATNSLDRAGSWATSGKGLRMDSESMVSAFRVAVAFDEGWGWVGRSRS